MKRRAKQGKKLPIVKEPIKPLTDEEAAKVGGGVLAPSGGCLTHFCNL